MARKLILIKHAHVEVDASQTPDRWHLSEKGRESCKILADALSAYLPFDLMCSEEVKATETAALLAEQLQIPFAARPDLEEHNRNNVPVMRSGDFISLMELFFRRPDELVLGAETATSALSRFESAIDEIISEKAEGDVAVVTHGTVIALFVAHHNPTLAGFRLWRE